MKTFPGEHINMVAARALGEARKHKCDVEFSFNDTPVTVTPMDNVEQIIARWDRDREIAHQRYINSPEYKEAEERRAAELKAKMSASMKETATSEAEMREAKDVWPYTMAQLTEYVTSLVERRHDYGTCVYAMSMAAVAAFNFVSHQLGVTGFQASCADLDFLRRTRSLKGPFILLKAEDALFPQYNLVQTLTEAINEWQPWLAEQARARLLDGGPAHPNVIAHWQRLAGPMSSKR